MPKIRVVTPLHAIPAGFDDSTLRELAPLQKFGLQFDEVFIKNGPASIESAFDEVMCAPYTVAAIIEAEQQGADAVIINCMGDPGLHAARECVSIPVIGPGEAAMHVAAMLGHRFAVVSVLESVRPLLERNVTIYGLMSKFAALRVVNIPVLHIEDSVEELITRLYEQSTICIEQNHADCIILGCTGFLGVAERLEKMLNGNGYPVRVINPMPNAAMMAAALVNGGLSHSAAAYPLPNRGKSMVGFDIPVGKKK